MSSLPRHTVVGFSVALVLIWASAALPALATGNLSVVIVPTLLLVVGHVGLIGLDAVHRQAAVGLERQVGESERQWREIVDASSQGILHLDPSTGKVLSANPAAVKMLGFDGPDRLLALGTIDELMAPEDRARVQRHREARAAGRSVPEQYEVRGCRPDGTPHWFAVHSSLAVREGRSVARVFLVDMTERKATEAALELARDKADVATRSKNEFLANMSHEIRTPMNALIGLSDLVLKTPLDPQQRDYLEKIHGSAHTLLGILNDILDFSKIEAGQLMIEHGPFELDDILGNMVTLLGGSAEEKGLELVLAVPAELPHRLVGDAQRLSQILINLVANAIKFTDRGEIVVSAEQLSATEHEIMLCFAVRDSGIGLSQAQIGGLFQAFAQADGSAVRRFGGAGLGLVICKRLVELMGGKIEAQSTPGIGSIFSFTIRLGIQQEPGARPPRNGLQGLRLLVVDDNDAVRTALCGALTAAGMTMVGVENAAAALRCVADGPVDTPFDMILVDWKLPDKDGLDLAEELRSLNAPRRTPIRLMVSSAAKASLEMPVRAAGFDRVLVKPLNASHLVDAIAEAMAMAAKAGVRRPAISVDLRGAAILLVEDNQINQLVAKGILEGAKARVTVARNGRDAIAELRLARFDVVLMDLQMPDLDGFATTRIIREELRLTELPIVAMTAHALAQERRRCFEAGMNEHVTKPVDPQRLLTVLERFVPTRNTVEPAPAPVTGDRPLPGIDLADAMRRLGGNRELLDRVYDDFCENYAAAAAQVAALMPDDLEGARRLVHTVKGVAGNIGAKRVFNAALALEAALKSDDLAAEPIEAFRDALAECVPRAIAPPAMSVETALFDESALRPLIAKLDPLLRKRDLDAEDCFAALKAICAGTRLQSALGPLEASLQALDFEAARAALQDFAREIGSSALAEAR
ncbi:MAG TPA: response regulator [Aliidongia sp.]|nr:response regulator [Aliidongia sp.]